MTLPALEPSSRDREYKLYSREMRARVVLAWLVDGKFHRTIDEEILGLDAAYSRGYQSMGILHHLGLKKAYRGIFAGHDVQHIGQQFSQLGSHGRRIADLLLQPSGDPVPLDALQAEEAEALAASLGSSERQRRQRIADAPVHPERIQVVSFTYRRNPDIVAEALIRANGTCERCGQPAPFSRSSDGTPYLEVHHTVPLASGGEDTLANVMALCPNCHRYLHHGV